LAAHIAEIGANRKPAAQHISTHDHLPGAELPMSFAQRRLWFLEQLEGGLTAYHISEAWRLDVPLDVYSLRRALQTIVVRHAPLRTTFRIVKGDAAQVIGAASRFDLTVHDLSHLIEPARTETFLRLAREQADRPFDLTKDVLLRATLLSRDDTQHDLLL